MAASNPLYKVEVKPTPQGVKVELDSLYMYPDGHANLVFRDGRNWPLGDQYEVVVGLAQLLQQMQKAVKRK